MKSLLSIFIIAICVGVYFVYIKPLTLDVRVLSAKKAEYVDVLNRVKEIKAKRESVFSDYNSISPDDINRLYKIIPDKIDQVILLNNLSVLGSKHSLVISELKVIPGGDGSTVDLESGSNEMYKTTTFTFKLKGDYNQFVEFLNEVESSLSLMDIVNLDIKSAIVEIDKSKSTAMAYTLEVKTYSQK